MTSDLSVLVVDDEDYVRDSLRRVFEAEGCQAIGAAGIADALAELERTRVDVVVSDLRMPGGGVHALLERLGPDSERVPVIVITGVGTVSEAVGAMKAGAFDLIQKPVDPEQLLLLVERAVAHRRLRSEVTRLRERLASLHVPRALVGRSGVMEHVRERLAQVAPTASPVLITGESGTGKELAAEELHRQSGRAAGPIQHLRCIAADANELSRVLAAARAVPGTTLLLDEIAALEEGAQVLLPSALDELGACAGRVRVVATSNADLEERVRAGRLRAELFWRLNVVAIEMPPLREHREDLPDLVEHFLSSGPAPGASRGGLASGLLAPQALEVMASYTWPGNVRELRNFLERAIILGGERTLDAPFLRALLEPALAGSEGLSDPDGLRLRPNLDALERELVQRALVRAEGVKKQAAFLLGVDPRNLGYYLRKHGL